MTEQITNAQIGLIKALAAKARMDDDTYRAFLGRWNVGSSKQLTRRQAAQVIDRLKEDTGQSSPAARGSVAGLNTPIAKKLQALWITAYNLGLIRDRTDRAMLSFLERQTGVSHTRFLGHPRDATAAIEALKSWLARAGGVEWPASDRGEPSILAKKRAVIEAQWRNLEACSGISPGQTLLQFACAVTNRGGWDELANRDLDAVQKLLGRKLRAAQTYQPHARAS